jgi:HEAT repeat protein
MAGVLAAFALGPSTVAGEPRQASDEAASIVEMLRGGDPRGQAALAALAEDPLRREDHEAVLRQALATDDHRLRQQAAIALAGLGIADREVLDELTRGLGASTPPRYLVLPGDPQAAQWALEKLGAPAVPALVGVVKDPQHRGRRLAIDALGTIGPDAAEALPALKAALADRDDPDRHRTIQAKWRIDGDEAFAVSELVPLLDTPRGRECNGAVRVLALMGAEAREALPDLIRAMRQYKDYNVTSAVAELAPHAPELAVPALIDALNDPELAADAAGALPGLGVEADAIVPPLVRLLEQTDDGDSNRYRLAVALEPYGPDAWPAIPTLVRLLRHPNTVVRGPAAEMLGRLGPRAREAVPALTEALGDVYVAEEAAQALAKIMGGD